MKNKTIIDRHDDAICEVLKVVQSFPGYEALMVLFEAAMRLWANNPQGEHPDKEHFFELVSKAYSFVAEENALVCETDYTPDGFLLQ